MRGVVLHPLSTSNHNREVCEWAANGLYCILFLHQTTTNGKGTIAYQQLYCILFLHQTTTRLPIEKSELWLYCILFLHQTTTTASTVLTRLSCIASSFYIKPQRLEARYRRKYGCIASSFYIKPQQTRYCHGNTRSCIASSFYIKPQPRTPDTLIFGHLTASRHDTKRGGVHRGSRFDAVFTFSTNIRKIIFTEIRRCMSVQRAGARLRSDSSEANI